MLSIEKATQILVFFVFETFVTSLLQNLGLTYLSGEWAYNASYDTVGITNHSMDFFFAAYITCG